MLYSKNGDYPTILPNRIRMSNGFTRTGRDTFTEEEIKDSGYISVPDKPQAKIYQEIRWNSIELKWDVIKLEKNFCLQKSFSNIFQNIFLQMLAKISSL